MATAAMTTHSNPELAMSLAAGAFGAFGTYYVGRMLTETTGQIGFRVPPPLTTAAMGFVAWRAIQKTKYKEFSNFLLWGTVAGVVASILLPGPPPATFTTG